MVSKIMTTIKELVKDKLVRFMYYRDGELVYQTEDGFEFPVPVSDTGTGTFKAEDKAILFMRWIRKRLDEMKEWEKMSADPYKNPEPSAMGEQSAQVFNSILLEKQS